MEREQVPVANAAAGTSVRIRLPDERLRSFATFYYFVDCFDPLEDFLYPEWGNVRFTTRGSWIVRLGAHYPNHPLETALFGPTDRAAKVTSPSGKTVGFGLTPLGWQRLVGIPAEQLANRVVPLGDAMGRPDNKLRAELIAAGDDDEAAAAIFDRLLLDRLDQTAPNPDWAIRLDHVVRERPHDVEAFAARLGVSQRTLARMCRRVFGFGSKRLLRRQRFLTTLGEMRINDQRHYVSLIDPDYFDQAHFVHEFREFMGLSPTEYLSVPRPLMGQAALVQSALGIPLSFALPPAPEE
ncbi:helix-turn-helix domain-containing protein [Sphingomonas sp.]|jgi:AraC-like DNA-binding protein|uniref:AraC family transcriptional regulator n=1 Tax=Sphingomonas sp. TaxID=28214 RepID=UPI002E35830D|nr:helix-turn-helix domain-containing protein [Sphingomonas sp.]HEX4692986.1 helix-turn-helix domain-containing protein [Sphingomonas sp.]